MNFRWIVRASIVVFSSIVAASSISTNSVQAQSWQLRNYSLALKSGESVEFADIYRITNCASILLSTPEVTVMDGPPGVTASVTEAMVSARYQGCPNPVKGGKLRLSAGKIEDYSQSIMTLRIKYKTKDGDREESASINLTLFP
jgi:hypothetical protein